MLCVSVSIINTSQLSWYLCSLFTTQLWPMKKHDYSHPNFYLYFCFKPSLHQFRMLLLYLANFNQLVVNNFCMLNNTFFPSKILETQATLELRRFATFIFFMLPQSTIVLVTFIAIWTFEFSFWFSWPNYSTPVYQFIYRHLPCNHCFIVWNKIIKKIYEWLC